MAILGWFESGRFLHFQLGNKLIEVQEGCKIEDICTTKLRVK